MLRTAFTTWFANATFESLDLGGCEVLTNASLALIAERFPRLTTINLTLCDNMSPEGVISFLESCPEMQVCVRLLRLYSSCMQTPPSLSAHLKYTHAQLSSRYSSSPLSVAPPP